jgi:ABC-type dipeptide/oligopeptide/nickel transport system permease component
MSVLWFVGRGGLTLWLASSLVFVALRLLPNNILIAQSVEAGLDNETITRQIQQFGLDKPILEQYLGYYVGLLQGDWGRSLRNSQPVRDALIQRTTQSFTLVGLTMLIGVPLGIVWGSTASQVNVAGRILMWLSEWSLSIPVYWTGTLALFIFGLNFGISQQSWALPIGVLVFHVSGSIARLLRVNIQQIQRENFVWFAKSKGLSASHIQKWYVLRVAILPIIPLIGIQMGILLGATVATETIFSRAGLGTLLLDGVLNRDYPIVQGVVLVLVSVFIFTTAFTRWLVYQLDPRLAS